jgi:hypothetical protein
MWKPIVFASSLLLGGAAAAVAISVQLDRTTLTKLPPPPLERTTETLVRVQSALPSPPLPAREPAVTMDEVWIRAQPRARLSMPAPKRLEYGPCSEWRDLGPKALADSLSADQHRVRALCLQP